MAKRSPSAPAQGEPEASKAPDAAPAGNGGSAPSRGSPPVWKKRLYGSNSYVECAVFRHEPENGQPSSYPNYSIMLDRSYKDEQGVWKATRSLRREDLLVAAHVLQRAYAWITEQEQER